MRYIAYSMVLFMTVCLVLRGNCFAVEKPEVLDIDSRLELFVDAYLIEEMKNLRLKLNQLKPAPASPKPAIKGHYTTIMKDGEIYRQYCRRDGGGPNFVATVKKEITLYAESKDGINWTRPDLGLYPNTGVKNTVLANVPPANHNFTPFMDSRPGVPPEEKYKAVGGHFRVTDHAEGWARRQWGDAAVEETKKLPGGLTAFVSPDGIHWKKLREDFIVYKKSKAFDSQNVAFWSVAEQQYVCYFRVHDRGFRAVARTTSKDFLKWTEPIIMKGRMEGEQWYTNGTHPYFRAPHIYIAPATRFLPNEGTNTRVILMTTRAGSDTYDRTFGQEDFLPDPAGGNRTNYIAWTNGAQTGPQELSFYNLGSRYTLRLDGFGSLHAEDKTGEMITKPLRFAGNQLLVNFKTHGNGSIQVELLDASGKPIPGFTVQDSVRLEGDEIEKEVVWKGGKDLGKLSDKVVRLHFVTKDADLYALRFSP